MAEIVDRTGQKALDSILELWNEAKIQNGNMLYFSFPANVKSKLQIAMEMRGLGGGWVGPELEWSVSRARGIERGEAGGRVWRGGNAD